MSVLLEGSMKFPDKPRTLNRCSRLAKMFLLKYNKDVASCYVPWKRYCTKMILRTFRTFP